MADVEFYIHRRTPQVCGMGNDIWINVPLVKEFPGLKVTVFLDDAAAARTLGEQLIAQADRVERIKAAEAAA